MNLETKIIIYKFTPQVFTLTHNPGLPEMDKIVFNIIYSVLMISSYFFRGAKIM